MVGPLLVHKCRLRKKKGMRFVIHYLEFQQGVRPQVSTGEVQVLAAISLRPHVYFSRQQALVLPAARDYSRMLARLGQA